MKVTQRKAISTTATVAIIVVILVIAGVAGYFVLTSAPTSPTTTTTTTQQTTTTTTQQTTTTTTTQQTTTTTTTSAPPITLAYCTSQSGATAPAQSFSYTGQSYNTPTPSAVTTPAGYYGPTNSSQLVDESQGGAYDALDPAYAFYLQDTAMLNAAFQDLVMLNGTGGSNVVPVIADTFGVSNSGCTNWFHIRSGVTFSDGTAVTSYDAWFSMARMLFMNTPSGIGPFNWNAILYNLTAGGAVGSGSYSFNSCGLAFPWGLRAAIASVTGMAAAADTKASCDLAGSILAHMLSNFNPSNSTQAAIMAYPNQGLVAPNATTFESNFLIPIGQFGFQLYSGFDGEQVINPAFVDAHGGVVNNTLNAYIDTNGAQLGAGSGPYYVASVAAGLSPVVFKATPNYWAVGASGIPQVAQAARIPVIIYQVASGDTQLIGDFGTNAAQLSAESIAQWQNMYNGFGQKAHFTFSQLLHEEGSFPFTLWWDMAHQVFPTNITAFDRFFIAAVNYTALNAPNYFNGTAYASFFVAPLTPAFAPYYNSGNLPNPAVQNTTLAFNDLQQAGIQGNFFTVVPSTFTLSNGTNINAGTYIGNRHGTQLPPVKLYYTVPLLSELQAQLQGIISDLGMFGVSATAVGSTSAQFNILTGSASTYPEFLTLGWGPDYLDPFLSMYEPLMLPSPYNGWYSNSTVIAEVHACLTPPTDAAALACSTALNKMAFDNAIWAPFPDTSYYYFWIQPYISGFVNNPFIGYWYNLISYTPVAL